MPEPLVLIPGMMCDARLFGPQIAELSAGHTIVCAPITRGERIEEIASGLLDQLPRRFALAGLGMGGVVAMEILRRAPDRVARLALIATHPLPETPQTAATREPRIIKVRTGGLMDVMRDEIRARDFAPGPQRQPVLDLAMDMAETLGAEVFVRQSRALQRRKDQQATLARCKVPTLILCGAHDEDCPVKRHSFMAELIPGAELTVLEDAGRLPPLEQPEATTRAFRNWLARSS